MFNRHYNVLVASDIAQFADKKTMLGDTLHSGKLSVFYDLYNLAQKRRFKSYKYALEILSHPMHFTDNDTLDIDRTKEPWPKNQDELNTLRNAKIKCDELILKLIS
ncbi:hypothetical protein [Pantoea sp. Nvir]|uniref:hypothetical protein n=1 Tax=Pantoea sp. Nvir TaxID=2576760 RepID=UPI001F406BCE|nr:hypothetical protein [Pantoea sp. Nvir]CAJ0991893.1 Tail-specific protease [Pantoea sp. Nvir]